LIAFKFDLQGHRGARGLSPENTLPSFEKALDVGVTSIETDVHLTRDGVPILVHDPVISNRLFRALGNVSIPAPSPSLLVSSLTLAQIQSYCADRNPDPVRFPNQNAAETPLATWYARQRDRNPFAPPSLEDLFAFATAYAGPAGEEVGKTPAQREQASRMCFDLEIKRVPFHPEVINDAFAGDRPGLLEERVVEAVHAAGMVARTTVRSFDHRSVRALRRLEPGLTGAILFSGTLPADITPIAKAADAQVYCPDYLFLDPPTVTQAHAANLRVIPWTVNDPDHWRRLLDWGVDGLTTDFPDRLAEFLRAHRHEN
jgi:glycerophosphoryl diester phosphodiesterase